MGQAEFSPRSVDGVQTRKYSPDLVHGHRAPTTHEPVLLDCNVTKGRSQCIREVAVSAAFENRLMCGAAKTTTEMETGVFIHPGPF